VPGRTLEVVGRVGRSYGAPRIVATETRNLGAGTVPAPITLTAQPNAATEWRLVTIKELFDPSTAVVQPAADVASHGDVSRRALAGAGIRATGRGGGDDLGEDREASLPDRQGPPVRDPAAVSRRRRRHLGSTGH
jgi:hypothetical protein